jgi:2-keto-4-pentenoate hydratase
MNPTRPPAAQASSDARWNDAAALLLQHWQRGAHLADLPAACRPADRSEGYAVQRAVARLSGESVAGWKIAATSIAGQQHIGVDGPLAGRLLASRLLGAGATVPLAGSRMGVAEAEFAFRFGQRLAPRAEPYHQDEVMAAVDTLHPAIELPDSRFEDFVHAGAPQLIADCACANWLVVGPAVMVPWRSIDLAAHAVRFDIDDRTVATGQGSNVLGDPRIALTWIVNELSRHADGVFVGDLVTTGTCVVPVPIAPGQRLRVDYGVLGSLSAALA